MNISKYYTTFDVVRIIDIKMERLQDWLKKGYIEPTKQEQVGRGMKKYFDRLDLYIIQTFKYLIENGITREEANKWTRDIRKSILSDQEYLKLPVNQSKAAYDRLSKLPNCVVFCKGGSLFGIDIGDQEDIMIINKNDNDSIKMKSSMKADAVHVINFAKMVKQVDSRLEE